MVRRRVDICIYIYVDMADFPQFDILFGGSPIGKDHNVLGSRLGWGNYHIYTHGINKQTQIHMGSVEPKPPTPKALNLRPQNPKALKPKT